MKQTEGLEDNTTQPASHLQIMPSLALTVGAKLAHALSTVRAVVKRKGGRVGGAVRASPGQGSSSVAVKSDDHQAHVQYVEEER